jgi:hypothetical protein
VGVVLDAALGDTAGQQGTSESAFRIRGIGNDDLAVEKRVVEVGVLSAGIWRRAPSNHDHAGNRDSVLDLPPIEDLHDFSCRSRWESALQQHVEPSGFFWIGFP